MNSVDESSLPSERIKFMVASILDSGDQEKAALLLELLNTVADPKGNQTKYGLGLKAMREAYTRTADFEKKFEAALQGVNVLETAKLIG